MLDLAFVHLSLQLSLQLHTQRYHYLTSDPLALDLYIGNVKSKTTYGLRPLVHVEDDTVLLTGIEPSC